MSKVWFVNYKVADGSINWSGLSDPFPEGYDPGTGNAILLVDRNYDPNTVKVDLATMKVVPK